MWRVVTILALLAGCERANEPVGVELPMPKITVKLLDAGSEPRAELRGHPHAGAKQTFVFTRSVDMRVGNRDSRQDVMMTYDIELVGVEDGAIHARQTLRALTVNPPLETGDPSAMIGATLDTWRDARGAHVRPSLRREPHANATPSTPYPELLAIAPEEPVGVGARWHEEIEYGPSHASVDVELLARVGDHVRERLTYRGERTMKDVSATYTGMMTGDFRLDELDGTAEGSNSLVFHRDGHEVPATETLSLRPAGT